MNSLDGLWDNIKWLEMSVKTRGERREELGRKQTPEKKVVKFFLHLKGIKSKKICEFPTGWIQREPCLCIITDNWMKVKFKKEVFKVTKSKGMLAAYRESMAGLPVRNTGAEEEGEQRLQSADRITPEFHNQQNALQNNVKDRKTKEGG